MAVVGYIALIVVVLIVLAAIAVLIASSGDIARYRRIRRM
jgi:hypothetical protein